MNWICNFCSREAEYRTSGFKYCKKHWETVYLETKMKLSVNILNWNTFDVFHKTLHILKDELKNLESELIVVDNGSTDGGEKFATIRNKENLGISVGKNQGIRASRGEYILLLDGDIMPVPNSIRCLVTYMDSHPEIDALGFHPNKFSNQENKGGQKHYEEYCQELVDVRPHKNHCIYYGIYRRKIFEAGIFLDETYGVGYGYEDLDFYMQMKAAGYNQFVCHINHPAGRYFHAINSSIRQMGYEKYMETSKKRSKRFIEKWGTATVGGIC